MNRIENIREALSVLKPKTLEIIDESYLHKGHKGNSGGEYTHIKLIISDIFGDVKLIEKHRIIQSLLKQEFDSGMHALSIILKN